jgi:hypothetical protein
MSDDSAYSPGAPETDIDHAEGCPAEVNDGRGRRGDLTLTNDHIRFGVPKHGPTTGNIIGDLAAGALEHSSSSKQPDVLLTIAEVRAAGTRKRRLLPDLYEFTQADGDTCRFPMKQGRKWEPIVRRLLVERHGCTVVDDGSHAWRVR